jgi:hypothetical protein
MLIYSMSVSVDGFIADPTRPGWGCCSSRESMVR